jgi:RNA polymerase sigma factor (sigma-70 family)
MATIAPEVPVLARDEAFEKLYRRYVKDVYHYALALLRNPADAEDVTQTTFLNAYRAFQRGEEIRKPQNWLIKIAHNVARTRYAHISRRVKEVPLEDHVAQLAVMEEEKPDVDGVLRALGRLPFNQRAALVMRELEGRSYSEIADTLGVSVAAVETLIFRARRSLRVRTAALRSILGVPLPGTLAHFADGGSAAAGGIGASMVIKAAVALVVGGVATGLGVERSQHAEASPQPRAAARVAVRAPTTAVRQVTPSAKARTVIVRGKRVAVSRRAVQRPAARHSSAPRPAGSSPATQSAPASAASAPAAPAATATTAAPAPSAAVPSATQAVQTVVDTVQQTVQQTVTSVTAPLPVSVPQVPQLPVQAPPLPKLP